MHDSSAPGAFRLAYTGMRCLYAVTMLMAAATATTMAVVYLINHPGILTWGGSFYAGAVTVAAFQSVTLVLYFVAAQATIANHPRDAMKCGLGAIIGAVLSAASFSSLHSFINGAGPLSVYQDATITLLWIGTGALALGFISALLDTIPSPRSSCVRCSSHSPSEPGSASPSSSESLGYP